ncbi:MaoC family dehydratase [Nocardia salmonicida]|uniref:MaoC family dehydratase n=1 Tax=Nocardia salmonicida TaxID=53431 RepID=UPI0033D58004
MTAGEMRIGASWEVELVAGLTRTQIVQYAGASGDFNPLHTDERYATEVGGSPSVFAHGMLTAGLTSHGLRRLLPAAEIRRFGGRFLAQVWPGDTLTLEAVVEAIDTVDERIEAVLSLDTLNQHHRSVFKGSASVVLA